MHPPFVEIKSYRSPKSSFINNNLITEPHFITATPDPSACRNETGQCSCARKRAAALGAKEAAKCTCARKRAAALGVYKTEEPSEVEMKYEETKPAAPSQPIPPKPAPRPVEMEADEKLYVSVDTHTDNTVVETKSMQTVEEQKKSCCGAETQTPTPQTESVHSEKTAPVPSKKTSNVDNKKRTYPILNGRRKSDEDGVVEIDTTGSNAVRYKVNKNQKNETSCGSGKSCQPSSSSQIVVNPRKSKTDRDPKIK